MRNGYFQLVTCPEGFGVHLIPPQDGGNLMNVMELANYLDFEKIPYNLPVINQAVTAMQDVVIPLGTTVCPRVDEKFAFSVAPDKMSAVMRFYPPSSTGNRTSVTELTRDLQARGVIFGACMDVLEKHCTSNPVYCTDIVVAKGQEPRHGTDARIEYYFDTNNHARPVALEDGSVDYFNLDMIHHVKKGDLLAKIIPEDPGDYGMDVKGTRLKPRDVRRAMLKYGHNIEISEDKLSITSMVDGHVQLVEGKVFVSDVYVVENVDLSTGNIDYQGSVQVNGNVVSNMRIVAGGNVIVNGIVEGAYIQAGGNIVLARGMSGMGKGELHAGGNVVGKFLESTKVIADGYVHCDSILHSEVISGLEVVVDGRKGLIAGGHIQATNKIEVKMLGNAMGATTVVEVGVNPKLKAAYVQIQKEISEIVKVIMNCQPVISNFTQKKEKGGSFTKEQLQYVKDTARVLEAKKAELEQKNAIMQKLSEAIGEIKSAEVVVNGIVASGTTIVIGELSMVVKNEYKYCKFRVKDGDVTMLPI